MDSGMSFYRRDPRLEELLAGKRVALVGPSPHLTGSDMGGLIDSYDIVCRPNQMVAMPRHRICDYGSRTDVLITCGTSCCYEVLSNEFRRQSDFIGNLRYAVCLEEFSEERSDGKRQMVYEMFKAHDIPSCQLPREFINFFKGELGCIPNTGMAGILMLLCYPISELYVTGMSFYNMGRGGRVFYDEYYDAAVRNGQMRPRIKRLQDKPSMEQPRQIAYFQKLLKTYPDVLKVDSYLWENFDVCERQKVSAEVSTSVHGSSDGKPRMVNEPVPGETNGRDAVSIFTFPGPFKGENIIAQRNAIMSWMELKPSCEIILLGDNPGVAEFARKFDLRHVPEIGLDSNGSPLFDDVLEKVQFHASNDILMYASSDTILLSDVMGGVHESLERFEEFLLTGARWESAIAEEIEFDDPGWEKSLRQFVHMDSFKVPDATGFFAFTREFWSDVPSLPMVGEKWCKWLAGQAIEDGKASIDASDTVMAVHQVCKDAGNYEIAVEDSGVYRNADDKLALGNISGSTWKLTPVGIVRRPGSEHLLSGDFRAALRYFGYAWEEHRMCFKDQVKLVMESVFPDRVAELVAVAQNLLAEQPDNQIPLFILKLYDEIDLDQVVEFFKRGVGYLNSGRALEALACLKRATTGPRCFPELFYATALAFMELGDLPAAARSCYRGIESYPSVDHVKMKNLYDQINKELASVGCHERISSELHKAPKLKVQPV